MSQGETPKSHDVLNSRQIAHDLRSPISALNVVADMTTEMPEGARELIQMAIKRLEDMANRLEKQS